MSAQIDTLQDNQIINVETMPYWEAYGLHQDPFAIGADPLMYYSSPHWEEYIDLLQYLCHYNNDLLVIAGVSSCGKTTLVNEFIAQVDETMRTCYIGADNNLTPERLVTILADGFGLSEHLSESIDDQLLAYLDELQGSDKICVLAFDNAHTLPIDTLRTLLHLIQQQSEHDMRLHVLLLGEPQLQTALLRIAETEGCERDQIHNLTLEPFSLDETRRYLKHRLTVAGLTDEIPFSEDTIKRIYKLSEGVPGRINRIARRALINEMPQSTSNTESSWLQIHRYKIWGSLILATFIIGVSSVLRWANQEDALLAKKDAPPTIAFENASAHPPLPSTSNTSVAAAPILTDITQTSPIATPQPEPTASVITSASSQPNELESMANHVPKTTTPATTSAPADSIPNTIEKLEPPTETPATSLVKVPKKKLNPKSETRLYTPDEKRLLNMSASRYTLQLIGLSNAQTAKAFIAKHNLGSQVSYFRSSLNGKPLFVLVYGNYGSLQEARAATTQLPKVVQNLRPMPRSMRIIQDSIRQNTSTKR